MRLPGITSATLIAAAISITGAGSASAEGWQLNSWERHVKITGSSPAEFTYDMFTLHTTDTSKPGLMFSCSEKYGLNVLYSFDGVDFMELLDGGTARRVRSVPIYFWIADKKLDLGYYMVRRKDKVFSNQKSGQSSSAMLALLQDVPIRAKASGYFDLTYDLPPLDEQVAQFVEVCEKAGELADLVKESRSSE